MKTLILSILALVIGIQVGIYMSPGRYVLHNGIVGGIGNIPVTLQIDTKTGTVWEYWGGELDGKPGGRGWVEVNQIVVTKD